MKRNDLLKRLGIEVPNESKTRVFIDSDAKNEADDQFAIMHYLLSPSIDVVGIGAAHYKKKDKVNDTVLLSFKEIKKVLNLAEIDDVNAYMGSQNLITDINQLSDASKKIIEEAEKGLLYVANLGCLTNLASAILSKPSIAKNIIAIVNGGGPYPKGRSEFNFIQDIEAVRTLFHSDAEIWQIPQDVYANLEITLSEIKYKVYPCSNIGKYLYTELEACNKKEFNKNFRLRTGENWILGDSATIQVLLMNRYKDNYKWIKAALINDDGTYSDKYTNKDIKVYTSIDSRMTLEDFYSKLNLVYRV